METSEILKKVRQIEIKTRGCLTISLQANTIRLSKVGVCHFRKSVSINSVMIYVT